MCTQYKWLRCPTMQMTIMPYNTNDYAVPLQTQITLRNLLHNVLGLTHNCICAIALLYNKTIKCAWIQ